MGKVALAKNPVKLGGALVASWFACVLVGWLASSLCPPGPRVCLAVCLRRFVSSMRMFSTPLAAHVPFSSRDPSLQNMLAKSLEHRWYLKRMTGEASGDSNCCLLLGLLGYAGDRYLGVLVQER